MNLNQFILLCFFCGLVATVGWSFEVARERKRRRLGPISTGRWIRCVLVLVGMLLIAVVRSGLINHIRSRDWPGHPATVVNIETANRSTTIDYRYTFDRVDYIGSNLAFMSAGPHSDKSEILSTFWLDQKITIHVNPENHSESVILIREVQLEYFIRPLATAVVLWVAFLHGNLRSK